jgi:hypothetical protein
MCYQVVLTASRQASNPRSVRKNRSVERIESAHSVSCRYKHLKGLEPLYTRFVCFSTCITPQCIHFSLESILNKDKNRSTQCCALSVGGFWKTDAPKGTCSEPHLPENQGKIQYKRINCQEFNWKLRNRHAVRIFVNQNLGIDFSICA